MHFVGEEESTVIDARYDRYQNKEVGDDKDEVEVKVVGEETIDLS